MNEKRIQILSEMNVIKAIFTMSIPVVMGMMIQVLYNLVDTFFIGKLGDPNQLAAANITTPIFMMLMAIAGIIGTGAASYISRCLGEKNYEMANKTLSIGIALCVGLGLFVTIFGCLFVGNIVSMLGASALTYPHALEYSFYLFLGASFIMCNYAIGQLLRSEGSAMGSMIGMLIGTVANILLDPLFIFTFHMGIRGAAIATVLGNACGLVYYVYYFISGKSLIRFKIKDITYKPIILKEIFLIGIPASLSQMLMSVAMILCNNLAAQYGVVIVAGMGVASKIMTIGTFVFMGFAAGCQPLVGYNYGSQNYARLKEIIVKGMFMTSIIGVLLTFAFGVFAGPLIAVFTPLEQVVLEGEVILRALMFSLPFLGSQMIATTSVQAMGKGSASLFLAVARQGLFYIPILYLFNHFFQFNGLIYAQPLSDAFTLALAILVLYKILNQKLSPTQAIKTIV